jgi:beta-phosphoglucomutase-like phosphatase (HAD superfamily)
MVTVRQTTPPPPVSVQKIAAVLFDCDGVLVDSEVIALEVELAMLAELGLPFERADFAARFLGTHDDAFFAALDADSRAGAASPCRPAGLTRCTPAAAPRWPAGLTVIAGAAEAVAAWPGPKAVASSSRAVFLQRKLEQTGLWNAFEPHVYSADLVARGKPHPDIFLYAAEQIGVAPERCLVIEDSANGVLAARAAGMACWGFTGGGHCDESSAAPLLRAGAERVLCSWREAEDLFRALAELASSDARPT